MNAIELLTRRSLILHGEMIALEACITIFRHSKHGRRVPKPPSNGRLKQESQGPTIKLPKAKRTIPHGGASDNLQNGLLCLFQWNPAKP